MTIAPMGRSTVGPSVLTTHRLVAAARVWCFAMAALAAVVVWAVPHMGVGHDFAVFWVAARLALGGDPAAAYGPAEPAVLVTMFGPGVYAPFYYPPAALLLWLPFGFLPFAPAVAVWAGASLAAFATAVRSLAGHGTILVTLACPAAIICALYGQNGLMLGALLGAAAATLDRAPALAGIAIGCLVYKPHLAVLAPLILALTGRWRAFFAAAAGAVTLIGLSWLAFGTDSWLGFVADLPAAQAYYTAGGPGYGKFVSPFAAARLLGAPPTLAWAAQALCATTAIGWLIRYAVRTRDGRSAIAAMTAATGFCVPFLGEYDLPVLGIPLAWLIGEGRRTGWLAYERGVLAVLFVAPAAITLASDRGVPLTPVAMVLLLAAVGRRLRADDFHTGRPV